MRHGHVVPPETPGAEDVVNPAFLVVSHQINDFPPSFVGGIIPDGFLREVERLDLAPPALDK